MHTAAGDIPDVESRVLMEPRSNFPLCVYFPVYTLHAYVDCKWRYMLVGKNIQAVALLPFVKATPSRHVETPRSHRTVTRCRFALCSGQKASNTVLTSSSPQRLLEVTFSSIVFLRPLVLPASAYKLPANDPSLDPDGASSFILLLAMRIGLCSGDVAVPR